jgi:ADP-ribose pyrophosphatase YjhB (NUDIX family)
MYNKVQAYAAVKFADACLRALKGEADVIECAYVASQVGIQSHAFHKEHLRSTSLSYFSRL